MKIKFTLDCQDLQAFNIIHYQDEKNFNNSLKKIFLYLAIFGGIFIFANFHSIFIEKDYFSILILSIILFVILFFLKRLKSKTISNSVKKMYDNPENQDVFGSYEMDCEENYLHLSRSLYDVTYQWSYFKKIVETDDYYFLYIASNQAHIIPKTIIDGDLPALDKLLKRKITNVVKA